MNETSSPTRVIVAGGGVAGLEALLALRGLAGDRVALTLLAPEPDFVVRPLTVAEPFAMGHAERYPLADVARELGVTLVADGLSRVDADAHRVKTADEVELDYDALLLALGARAEPWLPGALTWAPGADADVYGGLLRDLEEEYVSRIVFVVPPGASWPLPVYELALMTSRQASGMGARDLDLHLVTSESAPLAAFGDETSSTARRELDAAEVFLHAGATSVEVVPGKPATVLVGGAGERLPADRVVTVPRLHGRRIPGVAADTDGFIPVDDHGRVTGQDGVWAAGDGTTHPIKQGGLATQQADAVARDIAARAGAPVEPEPFVPEMHAVLLTGEDPRPPAKLFGEYLTPWLQERARGGS